MVPQQKSRKEISLDDNTLTLLQIQADKEGRKLKNYIEQVLKEKANEFELSDEYKALMDDMLIRHEAGKINYTSWEKLKANILKK